MLTTRSASLYSHFSLCLVVVFHFLFQLFLDSVFPGRRKFFRVLLPNSLDLVFFPGVENSCKFKLFFGLEFYFRSELWKSSKFESMIPNYDFCNIISVIGIFFHSKSGNRLTKIGGRRKNTDQLPAAAKLQLVYYIYHFSNLIRNSIICRLSRHSQFDYSHVSEIMMMNLNCEDL